jgi:hypothetical protein
LTQRRGLDGAEERRLAGDGEGEATHSVARPRMPEMEKVCRSPDGEEEARRGAAKVSGDAKDEARRGQGRQRWGRRGEARRGQGRRRWGRSGEALRCAAKLAEDGKGRGRCWRCSGRWRSAVEGGGGESHLPRLGGGREGHCADGREATSNCFFLKEDEVAAGGGMSRDTEVGGSELEDDARQQNECGAVFAGNSVSEFHRHTNDNIVDCEFQFRIPPFNVNIQMQPKGDIADWQEGIDCAYLAGTA